MIGVQHRIIKDYESYPYDWGYVFGTLASDGSIYYNPPKAGVIDLTVKDYDFANMFAVCLGYISGIDISPSDVSRPGYWRTRLCHIMLVRHLLDIQDWKCVSWFLPKFILKDPDMTRGFLNAFFDGEGNVSRNGTYPMLRLSNTNKSGLEGIQAVLKIFGIESSIYPNAKTLTGNTVYALGIFGKHDVLRYYRDIGITMPRKMLEFESALYRRN